MAPASFYQLILLQAFVAAAVDEARLNPEEIADGALRRPGAHNKLTSVPTHISVGSSSLLRTERQSVSQQQGEEQRPPRPQQIHVHHSSVNAQGGWYSEVQAANSKSDSVTDAQHGGWGGPADDSTTDDTSTAAPSTDTATTSSNGLVALSQAARDIAASAADVIDDNTSTIVTAIGNVQEIMQAVKSRSAALANDTKLAAKLMGDAGGPIDLSVVAAGMHGKNTTAKSKPTKAKKEEGVHCHFYREFPYKCLKTEEEKKMMNDHLRLRMAAAIYITGAILVLSVLFEMVVHHCIHAFHHSPILKELFNALLRELTVLGFIGCAGFIACRAKIFKKLDRLIFWDGGEPPPLYYLDKHAAHDYREGHVLTELMVLFEDFHYIIFMVMVIYIVMVFWIGWNVKRWVFYVRHKEDISPELLLESLKDLRSSGGSNRMIKSIGEHLDFHALKFEFMCPFPPCQCHYLLKRADTDTKQAFYIADYVKDHLGSTMVEIIKIPPTGLFTLCLYFIVEDACRKGIMGEGKVQFIVGYLVFAWVTLLVLVGMAVHLNNIYKQLLPPEAATQKHVLKRDGRQAFSKRDTEKELENLEEQQVNMLPAYKLKDRLQMSDNRIKRWWYGTALPNRHEVLFFGYRNGPAMYAYILRMVLVMGAVVLTMCFIGFYCYAAKFTAKNPWLPIVTVIPVLIALIGFPRVLCTYGAVTCLGDLCKSHSLRLALEECNMKFLHKQLELVLYSKKFSALAKDASGAQKANDQYLKRYTKESAEMQYLYEKAFRLNAGEDAKLELTEMEVILPQIGFLAPPEQSLKDWCKIFDADGSGFVDLEEFKALIGCFKMAIAEVTPIDEMVKIWEEMDENGDSKLDEGELSNYLKTLGVPNEQETSKAIIEGIEEEYPDGLVEGHGHGGHGSAGKARQPNQVTAKEIAHFLHIIEARGDGF